MHNDMRCRKIGRNVCGFHCYRNRGRSHTGTNLKTIRSHEHLGETLEGRTSYSSTCVSGDRKMNEQLGKSTQKRDVVVGERIEEC